MRFSGDPSDAAEGGDDELPSLGAALRDDEDEAAPPPPPPDPPVDPNHLCERCTHYVVCSIASAVRVSGGEGEVTISRCGAFEAELDATR